jgi:hypothetical protein
VTDAIKVCRLAGLSDDDSDDQITHLAERALTKFSEPTVWKALLALAEALPKQGEVEGRKCWEIFDAAARIAAPAGER